MELGQLWYTMGLKTSGLQKDSAKAQGILGKLGGSASGLLNPAALGVTAVAGAVYKLGQEAYDFSKQFNSAMLEVKTISQSAQQDFQGFSESIVNMSLQGINDDAIGLSKAMYQVVSAGYDGAEGLAVLDAAAKAATGGVTDTITAADGLTTVLNAWGMKASEVTTVSDDFFTTVRLGKTTMGELGQNIAKVAPLAAATGISFKEVAAATATMTGQGTSTAEVMTQMKAAIIALNKNLGDGWSKTMTLNEGLQELRNMAGGSDVELQKLTGSSEAALAVLSLTGDNAQKAGEQFAEYSSNVGEAQKALNVMQEDADIMWKQVGNQFKAAMVDMGDGLLEASKGLASFLSAAMTTKDQLGDNFEGIGEDVDSFSDRMKVLRNEGSNFWGALGGAALSSNERIQKVVDREKKEIEDLNNEIKSINDEYIKLKESGASEAELSEFKKGLTEKFKAQKEATEQEYEVAQKHAKRMKILSLASSGGIVDHAAKANKAAKQKKDDLDAFKKRVAAAENLGVDPEAIAAAERIAKAASDAAAQAAQAAAVEAAKGTIQRIEEKLAKLKGKKGKFTSSKEEAKNQAEILKTQKKLDNEWLKVREIQYGKIEETNKLKAKGVEVNTTELEVLSDTLMPVETLTDEEREQLELKKKNINASIDQLELYEKMVDQTRLIADIFGMAGNEVYNYNEQLGDMLTDSANMIGGFSDIMEASKDHSKATLSDYSSIISLGIQFNKFMMNNVVDPVSNWFNEKILKRDKERTESTYDTIMGKIFGVNKEIENTALNIVEIFDNSDFGFSSDDIANAIVEGVRSGTVDSEVILNDMLDSVFANMLKQKITNEYLTPFFKHFEIFMLDNKLSDDELSALSVNLDYATKMAENYWNEISEIAGESQGADGSAQTGLAGAISNIQESTAGLIEAQFNALRINTIDILSIMSTHTGYLSQIANNTANSATLIARTNELLTDIDNKTASTGSYV